jgi:hypothetical protein
MKQTCASEESYLIPRLARIWPPPKHSILGPNEELSHLAGRSRRDDGSVRTICIGALHHGKNIVDITRDLIWSLP